jgi:hypothetical protein
VDDVTVLGYSVQRTSRHFRPTVRLVAPGNVPTLLLRLGRTSFAEPDLTPQCVQAWVGASDWDYRELYYLGRPGVYRHYMLAAGDLNGEDELLDLLRLAPTDGLSSKTAPARWQEARASCTVQGYAVYDAEVDVRGWPKSLPV